MTDGTTSMAAKFRANTLYLVYSETINHYLAEGATTEVALLLGNHVLSGMLTQRMEPKT